MNEPGKLYLFCGKMAAGKSTLATRIAQEQNAVLLSEDVLLGGLYPSEVHDIATYIRYTSRIKQTLQSHIAALLQQGLTVVLDFPANTVEQRAWLVGLARESGAVCELRYLVLSDEECKARLVSRAIEMPERRGTDTVDMFELMKRYFVEPGVEEGVEVVVCGGGVKK